MKLSCLVCQFLYLVSMQWQIWLIMERWVAVALMDCSAVHFLTLFLLGMAELRATLGGDSVVQSCMVLCLLSTQSEHFQISPILLFGVFSVHIQYFLIMHMYSKQGQTCIGCKTSKWLLITIPYHLMSYQPSEQKVYLIILPALTLLARVLPEHVCFGLDGLEQMTYKTSIWMLMNVATITNMSLHGAWRILYS